MLTYALEEREGMSRYEYLYRCIRADIERGTVAADEKLPSKRSLARHLGVSLITVENAYAQLVAEGYVRAVERAGYFANGLEAPKPQLSADALDGRADAAGSAGASASSGEAGGASGTQDPRDGSCGGNREAGAMQPAPAIDLTGRAVAEGAFPYRMWARTVRAVLSEESERSLAAAAADAAGSQRLREAIAAYLLGFRGMQVSPDQIVIGAGAQTLYHTIVQLTGRTRRFAVEDPGYPRLTSVYRANDVQVVPVRLDARGVSVAGLRESGADVLHCMPSHQFPTGLATPISRRYELLGWASERPSRYIVEDDYDCEFRLSGRPIPSLQSIDASERVMYVNTFTKSLGAAFRIGYLVLPPHLVEAFRGKLGSYASTVGAVDQLALARFIEQGDYERHVNRTRNRRRNVRAALVAALKASSGGGVMEVEEADAGLHFVLRIRTCASDADLVAAARDEGIAVDPLASSCATAAARAACEHRFVVNDAALDPVGVEPVAEALARAVAKAGARAASHCVDFTSAGAAHAGDI